MTHRFEVLPRSLQHLLNDHVAYCLEFLLLTQRQPLRELLTVVETFLLLQLLPDLIGFRHTRVLGELVYNFIYNTLEARRQVTVDLASLCERQPLRQLSDELLHTLILQRAASHCTDQLQHTFLGIFAQTRAVLCLLFIDADAVILIDLCHERGLNCTDTLHGEIALARIGGVEDHVDVNMLLLCVECSIPLEVVRMYLVRLRDVSYAGADQRTPVLHVRVAEPLGILAAQRDDGRPHISRMV